MQVLGFAPAGLPASRLRSNGLPGKRSAAVLALVFRERLMFWFSNRAYNSRWARCIALLDNSRVCLRPGNRQKSIQRTSDVPLLPPVLALPITTPAIQKCGFKITGKRGIAKTSAGT